MERIRRKKFEVTTTATKATTTKKKNYNNRSEQKQKLERSLANNNIVELKIYIFYQETKSKANMNEQN